jgi:hypothetical protein
MIRTSHIPIPPVSRTEHESNLDLTASSMARKHSRGAQEERRNRQEPIKGRTNPAEAACVETRAALWLSGVPI